MVESIAKPFKPKLHRLRQKTLKRQISRWQFILAAAIVMPLFALFIYAVAWAAWYRLPAGQAQFVDLRCNASDHPYYVHLCSGLASNLHGFPGHCYVVWTESATCDLASGESAGYVPRYSQDQIASLWRPVAGLMVNKATDGNMRNLNRVVAVVSKTEYDRSKEICRNWSDKHFHTGVRDCVSFTDEIANVVGLKRPSRDHVFPQDYVQQLKHLNTNRR